MRLRPWVVHLGLIAVVASWAVNQNVTKAILGELPPLSFLFVRFLALVTLALLLLWRSQAVPWTRRELALAAAAGLGGYTLNQFCFVFGLNQTTVFSTSLLISMSPLWTLLVLAAWRMEPVFGRQWLGVGLAFAGIALYVSDGTRLGLARGDLISLAGGIAFTSLNIFNKPLLVRHPPDQVLAAALLWGGIPLLGFAAGPGLAQNWAAVGWTTWGLVLYTVVVPIFLAYIVWMWAIRSIGVAYTAPYAYLTPVLAGVFSSLAFGETFGWVKVVGAAACLGGLALAATRPARRSLPG